VSAPWPVPALRGEENLYFDGARQGRLVYQACHGCGGHIFYPRTVCPECLSDDLELKCSAGAGEVYSFTVLNRPGHPGFADRVPYTVVLVDLDEGFRVLADLTGCDPADVRVGMRVDVVFEEVAEGFTIPRFRPGREGEPSA
jgi:uncharacterized OB-fold protein